VAYPGDPTFYPFVSSTTNATSWSLLSGWTVAAGERVVAIVTADGTPTLSVSGGDGTGGWHKVGQQNSSLGGTVAVFQLLATGTSTSLTIASTASEQYSAIVARIPSGGGGIEAAFAQTADPPNLAPTPGSKEYLWLAGYGDGFGPNQATAGPSGYNDFTNQAAGGSDGSTISAAWRKTTASSENPGTFTGGGRPASVTIAVWSAITDIVGTASITEAADTLAATGSLGITGAASLTEASDSLAAAAQLSITAGAAIGEAGDTIAASASLGLRAAASLTEGADSLAAAASLAIRGTASLTEGGDTLAATGRLPIAATVAIAEAADTLAAGGSLSITGALAVTEEADTLAATGGFVIYATAAIAEAPDTLSAAGSLRLSGSLAVTEGGDTLAATSQLLIRGTLDVAEGADTLVSVIIRRAYPPPARTAPIPLRLRAAREAAVPARVYADRIAAPASRLFETRTA